MEKTKWFIGIILVSILISSSKCNDDDGGHRYITIINQSNKTIVWQPQMIKISEIDTQYVCQKISKIVPGNSTYQFDNGNNSWEKEFITHYLQFILIDEDVYQNNPCDTIRKYNMILKRYQLTKEDLDRMDWTVTYSGLMY